MRLNPRNLEVVDDRVAEVLRTKTPAGRLKIGFNMWISARRMLLIHIGHLHPEWSQKQVNDEVAERLLHGSYELPVFDPFRNR
ncbi:MAG: hypothetical protein P8Z37_19995 [Acidobacteriota bacterium]